LIEVNTKPFDLIPSQDRGGAVLCVHGLTGTPYEMRPVAEALVERGFRVRGPLLPGHGSTEEELAETSSRDWIEAVHAEYDQLRAAHAQVFVAGLSLGGLLSLELASQKKVDGLLVVGTPLALKKPIPQLVGFVKHFVKMLGKSEGSDIQDPAARTRHPGYKRMPLNSVHELVHLQKKVRRSLKLIEAPALIAHGRLDRTASPADAMRIYRGLASKEKEVLYFEASGHVVSVDWDGPELARKATDFFERLRG
jgi:carboxylesterase